MEGIIGFIGTGNMGRALIEGITKGGLFAPEFIAAYDVMKSKSEELAKIYGIRVCKDLKELLSISQTIVIAVKPQNMDEVLGEIRSHLATGSLIISVAAGISLRFIEERLPHKIPIVRVMPNTPALVLKGTSVLARNRYVTDKEMERALRIFQAVGVAFEVEEKLMDAVTGLSGSGPAYVFLFLEALTDAGVLMGIPRDLARELVLSTVVGSVELARNRKSHFAELKDMVTSPGGTTIHGLKVMEEAGLRGTIMKAVKHATERAAELQKLVEK
ncbi:MAG: pyrroline-5-carboxylate reductase [Syntrophobacterales bacterium]|nr:pyrroline-5-carboxylate reductase [Syntrophobacterales bacterium]